MSEAQTTPVNPNVLVEEPSLSQDEIFHLLQCARRRDALRYLREHEGPVRMRDLAEQVAAWEHDTTVRALASAQRQRVYIPLYQTHLPKLDKAGVIDYQQSRGIVERTSLADVLDPYLRLDTERASRTAESDEAEPESTTGAEEEPDTESAPAADTRGDTETTETSDTRELPSDWTRYYMGATGVGLALVGGSAIGLPALSTLSGTAVGTLVSGLFAAVTTARSLNGRLARFAR